MSEEQEYPVEAEDFIRALKLYRQGLNFNKIGKELGKNRIIVQRWIEGTTPQGINAKKAEQWRQSILFGFNKPLDSHRKKK